VGILLSLTCFTLNSFGEVHQYRFEGNDAMDQVIATLITPFFDLQNLEPDWIKVFKVGSGILPKNRVVARIQTTVDNIVAKNARLWHS
jgi:adenylate cyclase